MRRRTTTPVYNDEPEYGLAKTDSDRAETWYAVAAEADNNPEQAKLCAVYSQREGLDWYYNAALQGDAYAMYALGKMYANGVGVNQNDTKAASWYGKASYAGIAYADYEFAKACHDGVGLDEDQEYADTLFQKALRELESQEKKRPDTNAEYILATMYELGLGAAKDMAAAERWRGLAMNTPEKPSESGSVVILQDVPETQSTLEEDEMPPVVEGVSSDRQAEVPEQSATVPPPEPLPAPQVENYADNECDNLSHKQQLTPPQAEQPVASPTPNILMPSRQKVKLPKKSKPSRQKKPAAARPVPADDDAQCMDFLDMITPSVLDFKHEDFFICGNTFRCVWAIREYPTETEQLAILRELGEKSGVTLHVYLRPVSPAEEDKIIRAAERRNHHRRVNARDEKDKVLADTNMEDVKTLITNGLRNKETLMHCAVFFELIASSREGLQRLQNEATSICTRSKFVCDKLWLRQQDGFLSAMPSGSNRFGSEFERVIPTSSIGNLYPFSYSGKTDSHGMYIGEDVNGTNIIVDFDARSESKTNGHILILGNSGEGKSYLLKIIITNKRQLGRKIYIIDVENEYKELVTRLGGSYLDMMGGKFFINVLEPRLWTDEPMKPNDEEYHSEDVPAAFRQNTRLSQHIAYLRDFFRCYKEFTTEQLDTLEILLEKLYMQFHITDSTNFDTLKPEDYPILSDLFKLAENELETYKESESQLYTKDVLRSLTLGLRSICIGAESRFFNGFTNVANTDFIDFSVAGMMDTNENLKNAMFLNIFSWMSHRFLTQGDTDLVIDELHMFVTNKIAVNYMRSFMKRGRKRNSDVITASQNVEDMLLPGIIEYTKPLFSIPTHSFLFNPGQNVDAKAFQQALSVPDSEWDLIKSPHRGHCLFRSGNERYHLHVIAPEYKKALFGKAGGS